MYLSKQIKQKNILPKYNIVEKKNCILHFGIGNFHRAHQALYVHELLEQNKDLSIIGVNLRSNKTKEKLYPEKCSYCNLCNWKDECDQIWEKDNYVNLVAGTNKSQIEKLKKNKVRTVEQLAKTNLLGSETSGNFLNT